MNKISPERLEQLNKLFEALELVSEGTGVFLSDIKADYSRWSKRLVDIYGLPDEYMYEAGMIWSEHIHPDDLGPYLENCEELFAGETLTHDLQYRAQDRNGKYRTCTCRGIVLKDKLDEPDFFMGVIRDNSPTGQIDPLTGLMNQTAFFEELAICMEKREPFFVALFGTTHFSRINDLYGYDFANRVLQHNARYMEEEYGRLGRLYRLDGIKLGLISKALIPEEFRPQYRAIREILHRGYPLDGEWVQMPVNCGGIYIDSFEAGVNTVFSCLTNAYEESKYNHQGDFYEFERGMTESRQNKLELINGVRNSVSEDCRDFMIYYQPIVDAKTEELMGAEALVRWMDPEGRVVGPDDFIPVLENDAMFPVLGSWILRRAMEDTMSILKYYPDFVINVNISYAQLQQHDFVDTVLALLDETGFPPENLCLEITERARMLDMDRLINVNFQLTQHGVTFAMDDFGTGFSSINILKHLIVRTVKLDRKFIMNVLEDPKEVELVSSVTRQARIFGATTCVEGVETAEMREALIRGDVDKLQGYYYSYPVPIGLFKEHYCSKQQEMENIEE